MGQPHKYQKEIIAWANGEEIQIRYKDSKTLKFSEWATTKTPAWLTLDDYEYRIKPEEKVYYVRLFKYSIKALSECPISILSKDKEAVEKTPSHLYPISDVVEIKINE